MVDEGVPRVTRAEHIAWCKKRASEYLDMGDVVGAWGSFISDMSKHPETRNHDGILFGSRLAEAGHLSTVEKMRHYIEGFG